MDVQSQDLHQRWCKFSTSNDLVLLPYARNKRALAQLTFRETASLLHFAGLRLVSSFQPSALLETEHAFNKLSFTEASVSWPSNRPRNPEKLALGKGRSAGRTFPGIAPDEISELEDVMLRLRLELFHFLKKIFDLQLTLFGFEGTLLSISVVLSNSAAVLLSVAFVNMLKGEEGRVTTQPGCLHLVHRP